MTEMSKHQIFNYFMLLSLLAWISSDQRNESQWECPEGTGYRAAIHFVLKWRTGEKTELTAQGCKFMWKKCATMADCVIIDQSAVNFAPRDIVFYYAMFFSDYQLNGCVSLTDQHNGSRWDCGRLIVEQAEMSCFLLIERVWRICQPCLFSTSMPLIGIKIHCGLVLNILILSQ